MAFSTAGPCDVGAYEAEPASAGDDVVVCGSQAVTLTAAAACDCPSPEFRWSEGATPITGWSPSPSVAVTPSVTTTYTVEIRCASPETDTDDVTVVVMPTTTSPDLGNTLLATGFRTLVDLRWLALAEAASDSLYRGMTPGVWPPAVATGLSQALYRRRQAGREPIILFRVTAVNCVGDEGS